MSAPSVTSRSRGRRIAALSGLALGAALLVAPAQATDGVTVTQATPGGIPAGTTYTVLSGPSFTGPSEEFDTTRWATLVPPPGFEFGNNSGQATTVTTDNVRVSRTTTCNGNGAPINQVEVTPDFARVYICSAANNKTATLAFNGLSVRPRGSGPASGNITLDSAAPGIKRLSTQNLGTLTTLSVDPSVRGQGAGAQVGDGVIVTLQGSGFTGNETLAMTGGGVRLIKLGVTENSNGTQMRARVRVEETAVPGPRSITITAGGQTRTMVDAFQVTLGPKFRSSSLGTIPQGARRTVVIPVADIRDDTSARFVAQGLTHRLQSRDLDAETVTVLVSASPEASVGPVNVQLQNTRDLGRQHRTDRFSVVAGTPATMTGATEARRAQTVQVRVSGGAIEDGATLAISGGSVRITNVDFTEDEDGKTVLTATVRPGPGAALTARNVTVTNPADNGLSWVIPGGFTVVG